MNEDTLPKINNEVPLTDTEVAQFADRITNYTLLTKPLTLEEIRSGLSDAGQITGVVSIALNDIGNAEGFDDFNTLLSEALTGSDLLEGISYEVVGFAADNVLHIEVSGEANSVLEAVDEDDRLICGQCSESEPAAEIESNGGICNTCVSENEDGG